jgi:peroxiredoxin
MTPAQQHRLVGIKMPDIVLTSTGGESGRLSDLTPEKYVLFIYPRTGRPGHPDPDDWAAIPGAKGCTAEACQFRDLRDDFAEAAYGVFGLSSQSTGYQREASTRLHLPYALLADPNLALGKDLALETFVYDGLTLYKRLTLIVEGGTIVEVVVPESDPANHPDAVLSIVKTRTAP